jgi:hypothetical protein
MIVMEEKLYTPAEAVKYLQEKRGILITVPGLRQRRKRGTATTHRMTSRMALWTESELDAIVPSPRTRRVGDTEEP